MKKVIVMLMSLVIAVCFVPGVTFAGVAKKADTSQLTQEQIDSATLVTEETSMKMPAKGKTGYYKFTADEDGYYELVAKQYEKNTFARYEYQVTLYKGNGDGTYSEISHTYSTDRETPIIYNLFRPESEDTIKAGDTYYFKVSNVAGEAVKKAYIHHLDAYKTTLECTEGGSVYDYDKYVSTGEKVAVTQYDIITGLANQDGISLMPVSEKGYAFAGLYGGGYLLMYGSTPISVGSQTSGEGDYSFMDGGVLTAKFIKATSHEKMIQNIVISKIKVKMKKNYLHVTFKSNCPSSDEDVDYEVQLQPVGDKNPEHIISWSAENKSYDSKKFGNTGEIKKIGGIKKGKKYIVSVYACGGRIVNSALATVESPIVSKVVKAR